jgi:hypothetical protein
MRLCEIGLRRAISPLPNLKISISMLVEGEEKIERINSVRDSDKSLYNFIDMHYVLTASR